MKILSDKFCYPGKHGNKLSLGNRFLILSGSFPSKGIIIKKCSHIHRRESSIILSFIKKYPPKIVSSEICRYIVRPRK